MPRCRWRCLGARSTLRRGSASTALPAQPRSRGGTEKGRDERWDGQEAAAPAGPGGGVPRPKVPNREVFHVHGTSSFVATLAGKSSAECGFIGSGFGVCFLRLSSLQYPTASPGGDCSPSARAARPLCYRLLPRRKGSAERTQPPKPCPRPGRAGDRGGSAPAAAACQEKKQTKAIEPGCARRSGYLKTQQPVPELKNLTPEPATLAHPAQMWLWTFCGDTEVFLSGSSGSALRHSSIVLMKTLH